MTTSNRTTITANLRTVFESFGSVAERLTPEQWHAQSLCPAWTAQGVVAHVTAVEAALTGWRPGDENPFAAIPALAEEVSVLQPPALLERYCAVTAARLAELATMTDEEFANPSITPVGLGTYGRFMTIREFDKCHRANVGFALCNPGRKRWSGRRSCSHETIPPVEPAAAHSSPVFQSTGIC